MAHHHVVGAFVWLATEDAPPRPSKACHLDNYTARCLVHGRNRYLRDVEPARPCGDADTNAASEGARRPRVDDASPFPRPCRSRRRSGRVVSQAKEDGAFTWDRCCCICVGVGTANPGGLAPTHASGRAFSTHHALRHAAGCRASTISPLPRRCFVDSLTLVGCTRAALVTWRSRYRHH